MNWKGRQMFGGGPSGIVQMMGGGMTPHPTHVMPDGTVMRGAVHGQGYQAGGLLIGENQHIDPSPSTSLEKGVTEETRVLKGLYNDIIKAMEQTSMDFDTIIDSRVTQGSVTKKAAEDLKKVYSIQKMREAQQMQREEDLIPEVIARPTPPLRPGMGPKPYMKEEHEMEMQAGGMVGTELFEEGDSDINNALNTMASVSNPEVPDMPASNGMALPSGEMGGGEMVAEEMTMDQGSGYEEDVMQLKDQFKNEIRSYVSQAGTTDIGQYLKNIRIAYNNQLNKIKKKHNVTEAFPSDELITEDFLAELSSGSEMPNELPGYDNGGEVELTQEELDAMFGPGRMPLENWKKKPDRVKRELKNKAMLVRLSQPQTTSAGLDRSALDSLMQERRENAKRLNAAARANYGSTSSRASQHYADAKNTGEATEAMAMDKIIADQISQEQSLLGAQATGKGIGGLDFDFSTAESESITIGDQVREAAENKDLMDEWSTLFNNKAMSNGKVEQAMEIWMGMYTAPPPGLTNYQSKRNFTKQSGADKGKKVSASFAAFYKDLVQSGASKTAIKKAIKAWVSYPIT